MPYQGSREQVVPGNGLLIALDRDHAKRLFGLSGDDQLRAFVAELAQQAGKQVDDSRVVDLGARWDAIHRCLGDGTLAADADEYPLNHCILGGRQMSAGEDYVVSLKRPDMNQHIAAALAEVSQESFNERFRKLSATDYEGDTSDEQASQHWHVLEQLRQFYSAAAENRDAVLFIV